MGTVLFWSAWVGIAGFHKLTTRRQRQRWAALAWLAAVTVMAAAGLLNYWRQGYITYL